MSYKEREKGQGILWPRIFLGHSKHTQLAPDSVDACLAGRTATREVPGHPVC